MVEAPATDPQLILVKYATIYSTIASIMALYDVFGLTITD